MQPVEISFALLLQQYSLSVVSSLPWSVLLFYLCWAGSNNTLRTDGATRARFPTAQQRAAWPPRPGIQQSAGPCQVLPTWPKNGANKSKHTLCLSPSPPVPPGRVRHLFSWANCFPSLHIFVFQGPGSLQTCRMKTKTQHTASVKLPDSKESLAKELQALRVAAGGLAEAGTIACGPALQLETWPRSLGRPCRAARHPPALRL